jgi:hypothetical protein
MLFHCLFQGRYPVIDLHATEFTAFAENMIAGNIYLNILIYWLVPQLHEDSADFIFYQGSAPPHVHASTLMDWTGTKEDEIWCS